MGDTRLIPRVQRCVDDIVQWVSSGGKGPVCVSGPPNSGKNCLVQSVVSELEGTTEILWIAKQDGETAAKLFSAFSEKWAALAHCRSGHTLYPYAFPPTTDDAFYCTRTCSLEEALSLSANTKAVSGFSCEGDIDLLHTTAEVEFTFYNKGHRLGNFTGVGIEDRVHMYLKPVRRRNPPSNSVFMVSELRERDRLLLEVVERWGYLYRRGGVAEAVGGRWKKHCLLVFEGWERFGLEENRGQSVVSFLAEISRVACVLCTSKSTHQPPFESCAVNCAPTRMALPFITEGEKMDCTLQRIIRYVKETGMVCSEIGLKTLVTHSSDHLRTIPQMEYEVCSVLPRLQELEKTMQPQGQVYWQYLSAWMKSTEGALHGHSNNTSYAAMDVEEDEDEDEEDDIMDEQPNWVGNMELPKVERGFFYSIVLLAVFMCRIRPKQLQVKEDSEAQRRAGKVKKRVLKGIQNQREKVADDHATHAVKTGRLIAQIRTLIETYETRQHETDMAPYWWSPVDQIRMENDLSEALSELGLQGTGAQINAHLVTAPQAQRVARLLGVPAAEQGGYELLFRHHGFAS